MKSGAVTLENVTLSYHRHPAVHHISGHFSPGSLTAIAGPNGAGKSTLLKAIAGVMSPDEGTISLHGLERKRVAYLPQAAELQRDAPLSVLQLVTSGLWQQTGYFGAIHAALRMKAADALASVGLSGFEKRALSSLSAGQFQRALFARVLLQDAPLILLDEPFTAVDAETTAQLLGLVQRWHQEKRTIICVLHDFEQIRAYFPECLLLARECIAWDGTENVLKPEHLLNARFFREAWAGEAQECARAL